jgi:CCR4-NOT transcriptional regulation complex NOT5 subunit
MDKKLALMILDAIEELDRESTILRAMLEKVAESRKNGIAEMEKILGQLRANSLATEQIHQRYAPIRERIEQNSSPADELANLLRLPTPTKSVN